MRNGNSSYEFDQIGNRVDAVVPTALTSPGGTFDYTTNALNQYDTIDDGTTAISPSYDLDGNMTSDGDGKTLTWNGENRLIKIEEGNITVENTYDGQGRRVRKVVKDLGVVTSDLRFFYDGWNLLYEIDDIGSAPSRRYVWGLDLSQSMRGAGGVGGLLLTEAAGTAHGVTYDANGNISEYIDLSDGSITAHLEYDAFGRKIVSTGTVPGNFGFSTKYEDTETGYLYYGFRYYDPETGRWPNRDPIGERGGLNVYGFVGNGGVNLIDVLGLASACCDMPAGQHGPPQLYDPETECCLGNGGVAQKVWDDNGMRCCPNMLRSGRRRWVSVLTGEVTFEPYRICTFTQEEIADNRERVEDYLRELSRHRGESVFDAAVEGSLDGFQAWVDGVIPFIDPLEEAGMYDPEVTHGLRWSQFIGGFSIDLIGVIGGRAFGATMRTRGLATSAGERFAMGALGPAWTTIMRSGSNGVTNTALASDIATRLLGYASTALDFVEARAYE